MSPIASGLQKRIIGRRENIVCVNVHAGRKPRNNGKIAKQDITLRADDVAPARAQSRRHHLNDGGQIDRQ
jgi:hypothetical protein